MPPSVRKHHAGKMNRRELTGSEDAEVTEVLQRGVELLGDLFGALLDMEAELGHGHGARAVQNDEVQGVAVRPCLDVTKLGLAVLQAGRDIGQAVGRDVLHELEVEVA